MEVKRIRLRRILKGRTSRFCRRLTHPGEGQPGRRLVSTGDPADAKSAAFDDSLWKRVTLPYAWNEDSAYKVSIHDMPAGIAWYRKHFRVPSRAFSLKIYS